MLFHKKVWQADFHGNLLPLHVFIYSAREFGESTLPGLRDISEFWNTDLSGCGAACVEDIGKDEDERYERLHYDKSCSYFNAGVLLINLDYWRKHKVDVQCVRYFETYPERIQFNDQDLLNVVLCKDKVFVPLKWNMQDGFYRYGIDKRVADWQYASVEE